MHLLYYETEQRFIEMKKEVEKRIALKNKIKQLIHIYYILCEYERMIPRIRLF